MKRKYLEYTDEDIILYAKEVKSIASILKKLNLNYCGGNYNTIKKKLAQLNVDISHWTGQNWNKEERLKDWSNYKKSKYLRKHLLKERKNTCEICKLDTWLNKPIGLEIHHIDGNKTNNSIENLQVLCLNCHYLTDNFRNRKNKSS